MAVVIAPENKLQFDSVCPLGDGEAGASSVAAETLRFTDGVTAGSLHTKLQRFLMILGFGQGSRSMHSSNSFANALADRVFHKKEKRKDVLILQRNLPYMPVLTRNARQLLKKSHRLQTQQNNF